MENAIPVGIIDQIERALHVLDRYLAGSIKAAHLFGSALDGGLKPRSDIDLFITVQTSLDDSIRRSLMRDLLSVSAPSGNVYQRPLEITVVAVNDIIPWRYPAKRELQFGEWLRDDIVAGVFEPALLDHDLAIILTKLRLNSVALRGPSAEIFFNPVPRQDFYMALLDTIAQWNLPEDWVGDECNIALALARIWYSATTGNIAPKDVAAFWVLKRLPIEYQSIMNEARDTYLGKQENVFINAEQMTAFVFYVRAEIKKVLQHYIARQC